MEISENSKGRNVLQEIQTQKDAFNKYADQLAEQVQQTMKVSEDSISKEQDKIKDSRHKVQGFISEVDDLINSKDALSVFKNIDKVEKSLEFGIFPIQLVNFCIPKFLPGKSGSSSFGLLSINKVEMRVKKQYITELKYCHSMSICFDGSVWFSDGISSVLMKVKLDEENITAITNIKKRIRDSSITTDNNILLADVTSRLKLLIGNNEKIMESKYSVEPLRIVSVYVTREHKVIVGAKSPGEIIPVTGRRVVIVMNKEGVHETVYEYDKNKQRLMTYPQSITTTSNGNVFVADYARDDKNSSNILALDKDGRVLDRYIGIPNINTINNPFAPVDITSTPLDNILISDFYLHIIHILDGSCNLLSYYKMTDIGIEYPHCIAFTNANTFHIGCSAPKTISSTTNAKLYEMEYSGF